MRFAVDYDGRLVGEARLNGKIDGVKLAAAHLEDGERIFPGAVSSS